MKNKLHYSLKSSFIQENNHIHVIYTLRKQECTTGIQVQIYEQCDLVHKMPRSAGYHIDRAEIVV